jgi:dolichol-phosphate mannosyltransferase
MPFLSIIIPCYNESLSVASLRAALLPIVKDLLVSSTADGEPISGVELIFIDDGSNDDTFAALNTSFGSLGETNIEVRILQHSVNRGLGAALRTGFAAAQGEIVVTTDGDGTYRFETIPVLIAMLRPGVDIVTASPYHPEGRIENVPSYRVILSRGSSLLYRLLVDWRVTCYTALFRVYRRDVVKHIEFESDGFLAGTELMVNAMLSGYHVDEYPAVLHSRAHGVSKAKIMRTIRAHLGFQYDLLLYRLGLRKWEPAHRMEGARQ